MSQLDVLRLFVDQQLRAAADSICSRLADTFTGYNRELLRLQAEVDRLRRLLEAGPGDRPGERPGDRPGDRAGGPGDRPGDRAGGPGDRAGDRAGDRPGDGPGDRPSGVQQVFTTEEGRGRGFSLHIKQEEGGASESTESPDWLGDAPEPGQNTSGVLQVRGRGFSLQIKHEEGGASGSEGTEMERNNDKGSPSSNSIQSLREDDFLMRPELAGTRKPEDDKKPADDQNTIIQTESSTEDSDEAQFEPDLQRTLGSGTRPPVDQRLLVCSSCGREFSSKRTLRKHIRLNTSQDQDQMSCSRRRQRAPFRCPAKSFSCRICGSSFYTQGILVRHAENHCKAPESRCGACGDRLESTETLRDHLRSHKELGCTCDVCGKKCSSIKRMEIHKRVHTGEKPFRCGFCSRDFSRKESLERHLKVHSGDRPHHCGLCSRSFTRREYLVHHLKTCHTETPGPPAGTVTVIL